ncbi:VWA domain-containing protein [Methylobacterium oryzisoli]|uniref:VWA domain-containing protein n=1 Tax=Methylobacterium oryzisoli TaxID=3385502 RepID=UPI0038911F75
MLTFSYPWLVLIAPLPLLAWWLLPAHVTSRAGLRVPFFARLVALTGRQPRAGGLVAPRSLPRLATLVACWLLVLVALMRPQWIEAPLHRDRPTRDLLLLVDLSGSMDTKDFTDASGRTVDRLTAVKSVLDDFLSRRRGDRAGIVVFGDAPFALVPFTTDLDLCRAMLRDTLVGMAGPRTALGDAIGLGIGLFDRSTVKARTIIALTDGNDTASQLPPAEAASIAKDKGIVIHTVAVGDPSTVGEDKLDETALKDVAAATGGGSFRALDRDGLARIYDRLDAIETRRIDTVTFRPRRDVYWVPLAAALFVSLLAQAVHLLLRGRSPSPEARSETGLAPKPGISS